MDIDVTTVAFWAIAMLSVAICWSVMRRDEPDVAPKPENIKLRDGAAIVLSSYWSHYHEGWSLVLFRDAAGTIRHVACGLPDGTFFGTGGYCTEEQIAHRLGVSVTAEACNEADVQSLLGSNNSVLEAAEEWRHYGKSNAP